MFKSVTNIMSGNILKRLKSVIVVPETSNPFKVIDRKVQNTQKLLKLKSLPQLKRRFYVPQLKRTFYVPQLKRSFYLPPLKRTFHSGVGNKSEKNATPDKHSSARKNWPSDKSLSRHADYKPLGVSDDWGPLSHKHELMPMDNVRYWHQHHCEVCDKLFEHKHKQRGDQSMDYNRHICSVCGGTKGSRRVSF